MLAGVASGLPEGRHREPPGVAGQEAGGQSGCSLHGRGGEEDPVLFHDLAAPDQLAQLGAVHAVGGRWGERRRRQHVEERVVGQGVCGVRHHQAAALERCVVEQAGRLPLMVVQRREVEAHRPCRADGIA